MGTGQTGRVALMAIQPRYSQAILAGTKTVEFRKRPLAEDVRTVLIYETAPTSCVVGAFTVADTVQLSPRTLWRELGAAGSITRLDFMQYFASYKTGVGLVVGSVQKLQRPITLAELVPRPAVPQSFAYIAGDVIDQISELQTCEPDTRAVLQDA